MLQELQTVWRYLAQSGPPQRSDVIFCFGSHFLGVARRAAELFAHDIAPVVVVTGGAVGRVMPHQTEADGYADVLRAAGVPDECIVVERHARNTGENVELGMRAAATRGVLVRRATLVAWPTSVRRCRATFRRQHPLVETVPHPAFTGLGPYELDLERAITVSLDELDRLRTYPEAGFIAAVPIPEDVVRAAALLASRLPGRAGSSDDDIDELAELSA